MKLCIYDKNHENWENKKRIKGKNFLLEVPFWVHCSYIASKDEQEEYQ